MWDVSFDPVDAEEAIAWFGERLAMTRDELAIVADEIAKRAFFVSGVTQLDIVTQAWEAFDAALKNGTTLEQFKADVGDELERAWQGSVHAPAWRLETIFRTNTQSAYVAGRYKQATDPEVIADRPWWRFDAVLDDRVTTTCLKCNGTVLPADSSWWKSHLPPLHFNCRSHFIALTPTQAKELGITKRPPKVDADQGFGAAPGKDDWTPMRSDYPRELWSVFKEKT
jgi:SPP1 gp7 family putative phage head morphogenesis protein